MKTDTNTNAERETTQEIPQSREAEAGPGAKTARRARRVRATKPRSDSTLEGLSRERKEQLAEWLVDENRGYAEVRELAMREWGVQTSRSALGSYFRQRLVPQQIAEATEAVTGRITSTSGKGEGPPSPSLRRASPCSPSLRRIDNPFGEAARRRASQLGFMALMERVPDGKAARLFLGIVDDFERRELARERLALAQKRERRYKRRDAPPRKSGIWKLPYEERMRHLKGVFGIAPDYEFAAWMTEEEKAVHLRRPGETGSGEGAQQGRSETAPLQQEEAGSRSRGTRDARAEGGMRNDQTGSAETGVGTAAGCRSHGDVEAAGGEGIASGIASASTIPGEVGVGPGVPRSFRVGQADPAVFSAAERGALSEPRINANGHESTAAGAKGQGSIQPQITRMAQMGAGLQAREVEPGTGMDRSRSAEVGAGMDLSEGRSKTAPLQGMADTRVGPAAGSRGHGNFGAPAVSYGRVLGAEGGMCAAGVPAVQPVLPSTESVRGVANWQVGGLGVWAEGRPVWPRPEAIY